MTAGVPGPVGGPAPVDGTAPRVVVLDYGSGNLRSAQRALVAAGAAATVTDDLDAAAAADGLVVPGVGAFAACMAGITALGAGRVIAARVAAGRPVLGICVGMQVLFEYGVETPPAAAGTGVVCTTGLGLLPGGVTRLEADRLPHMGWNTVEPPPDSAMFAGVPDGTRFYFVHSYAPVSAPGQGLVTRTRYGKPFVAAVERGALWATQFHPEKSGAAGAALLGNWVRAIGGGR